MWRSLFRRSDRPWTLDGVARPWAGDRPILELIRERLVDGELPSGEFQLPTDASEDGLPWAPGALDGVLSHHAGPGDETARVEGVIDALRAVHERPSRETLAGLAGAADNVIALADPVSRAMVGSGLTAQRVGAIGRVLAREGTRPEPVKLGIVLVGMAGDLPTDGQTLTTLGLHSDFTLYSGVALERLGGTERDLWALARRVHGWGRIHLVERLRATQDPEIRAWLLRHGFRNDVMDEYLAFTAAVAGGLDEALAADDVDDELFGGATDILGALARGGPAEDLGDYPPAAQVVGDWLRHARRRIDRAAVSLSMLEALDQLGAREELPEPVRREIGEVRGSAAVRGALVAALDSPEAAEFSRAVGLAGSWGVDVFDRLADRILAGRDEHGYLFFMLVHGLPAERLPRALDVAHGVIDLDAIATGPANELGLGPPFVPHRQLDSLLAELERFPGQGAEFVSAALRSPVIRNRNGAARVLAAWGPAAWPAELRATAEAALAAEPHESVRESLGNALRPGESSPAG